MLVLNMSSSGKVSILAPTRKVNELRVSLGRIQSFVLLVLAMGCKVRAGVGKSLLLKAEGVHSSYSLGNMAEHTLGASFDPTTKRKT